jgi:hypothetical protein
VSYLDYPAV